MFGGDGRLVGWLVGWSGGRGGQHKVHISDQYLWLVERACGQPSVWVGIMQVLVHASHLTETMDPSAPPSAGASAIVVSPGGALRPAASALDRVRSSSRRL